MLLILQSDHDGPRRSREDRINHSSRTILQQSHAIWLKNAGETYQSLVNKMFAEKLGVTLEVYIDDMIVEFLIATDHISHLKEFFCILNDYGIKLNPENYTFGVMLCSANSSATLLL